MSTGKRIAKSFEQVYFGGNWTAATLKEHLTDVSWQEATTKVHELNTIAILLNHIHYYVRIATKVLEGGPLVGKDAESFAHENISSSDDWQKFRDTRYAEAEKFINLVASVSEDKMEAVFGDEKWGSYYRNLQGIVEHTHYHVGQIVILKKIIRTR